MHSVLSYVQNGLSAIIDKLHCLEYLALPSNIHIQIKPDPIDAFEGVSNQYWITYYVD